MLSPNNKEIFKTSIPLNKIVADPSQNEGPHQFLQTAGILNNIIFDVEGIYEGQVIANDEIIGTSELIVKKIIQLLKLEV